MACFASAAKAHEFWIDPVEFQVPEGGTITASIRVGQHFKGSGFSFLPPQFRRFDYALGDVVAPVPGTIGDRPAVNMEAPGEGLVILVHESTDLIVSYTDFEKFKGFVEHKGAAWVLEDHAARGFPTDKFREVYSRYAKSLVGVGNAAGQDRVIGLTTEIVALENPYTGDMSDGIDVQVFYDGAPRANEQIEIFEKAADESVLVSTVMTDTEGKATIPVRPGYRYMLDSVVLREPTPQMAADKNAIWESLWANLTFAVPE